jgi:SRSO17 transposase
MERNFWECKKQLLDECKVDAVLFEGTEMRLAEFVRSFASCLESDVRRQFATQYVAGLTSNLDRKNVESIAYFHDEDRQGLQRFIGQMKWDHRPMLMELARQVGTEIGEADGVIVFDPSGHSKQGKSSVGVHRQWNGRRGKIENCQVGIYMAYVSRQEHVLVNERLYLPKEWTTDRKRCRKCGVPRDVKFATRLNLSLEMLQEQGSLLPHSWIAGDDEFGRSTGFRRDLRALNERYLLAVPSNSLVRDLEAAPPIGPGHGQRRMNPFVRVDQWCVALTDDSWTRVDVRDAEKGPLVVYVARCRVLTITERKHPDAEEMLVIIRRVDEHGETIHDYYLSNTDRHTPAHEFARVATAQHRVEECIKRCKSEAGLSDYETRTWWGWHHHQTLSILASWFLVQETRRGKKIHTGLDPATGPRGIGQVVIRRCRPTRRRTSCSRLSTPIGTKRIGTTLPPQETQNLATKANTSTSIG